MIMAPETKISERAKSETRQAGSGIGLIVKSEPDNSSQIKDGREEESIFGFFKRYLGLLATFGSLPLIANALSLLKPPIEAGTKKEMASNEFVAFNASSPSRLCPWATLCDLAYQRFVESRPVAERRPLQKIYELGTLSDLLRILSYQNISAICPKVRSGAVWNETTPFGRRLRPISFRTLGAWRSFDFVCGSGSRGDSSCQ